MNLDVYAEFRNHIKCKRFTRVIVEVTAMVSSRCNIRYVNECEWLEDDFDDLRDECHVYLLTRTRESIPVVVRLGMSDIVRLETVVPDGWKVADTSVGIEKSIPKGERED